MGVATVRKSGSSRAAGAAASVAAGWACKNHVCVLRQLAFCSGELFLLHMLWFSFSASFYLHLLPLQKREELLLPALLSLPPPVYEKY